MAVSCAHAEADRALLCLLGPALALLTGVLSAVFLVARFRVYFLLVTLLSPKVPSDVPEGKKAVKCLTEKTHVK